MMGLLRDRPDRPSELRSCSVGVGQYVPPSAPPAVDPGVTDDERRTISEMMAKGTYAMILLGSHDLDRTFERLQATDIEVVQHPTDTPWGSRDCAVRDPAGNLIRIQQLP